MVRRRRRRRRKEKQGEELPASYAPFIFFFSDGHGGKDVSEYCADALPLV
jgi:hypothetical protein